MMEPGAAGSGGKYASHCAILPPPPNYRQYLVMPSPLIVEGIAVNR